MARATKAHTPNDGPEELGPVADAVLRTRPTVPSRIAQFRAGAQKQAERIPAVTIVPDVGQFVAGEVRRRGSTFHPQYGESPVILFEPGTWETNTPTGWPLEKDGPAPLIDDIPAHWGAVIVGAGAVLEQLNEAMPGDLLYIERHEDGRNAAGQEYRNFTIMCERNGVTLPLKEHAARTAEAAAAELRAKMAVSASGADEEVPF